MNMWVSQCNDFKHILEPDDGHIGLKHVVWKKAVNCECVKVTDKDQYNTPGCYATDLLFSVNLILFYTVLPAVYLKKNTS
jgi:hypothetical protein